MKFALVNGQRQEAQPNLSGKCPTCDHPVLAKCGEVRIWHWAHKGRRLCDPWKENETEWHRTWKDQFPDDWQEIVHHAENGERHIADVKTDRDWVIEFQHSYLKPEERRSRDAFYPKLIWVVNGVRRKTDKTQFLNAWKQGVGVGPRGQLRRAFSNESRLLQEWGGSHAPIFFDFGEEMLGWLLATSTDGRAAYAAPHPRAEFIECHRSGGPQKLGDLFDESVKELSKLVADYEAHLRAQPLRWDPLQPRGFRKRRRF